MLSITLPIYWEEEFKTKANKTHLVGMNLFRNAYYHTQNKMKKHYHSLVADQISDSINEPLSSFTVEYTLYYKNSNSDPSNIVALIEKFALDGLKECGVIIDDSMKYHLGSSYTVGGQDKLNPRIEIVIKD